jgi:hypothetical protein
VSQIQQPPEDFLVAGDFTGFPLIFPHRTGAWKKCATYMSPLGCKPAPLWRSTVWGLQVEKGSLIQAGPNSATQVVPYIAS